MTALLHLTAKSFANGSFGGPLDLSIIEDGGLITDAAVKYGFVRRDIESTLESIPFVHGVAYCERVDFLAAPACAYTFCRAVEILGRVQVPERAQHIRVILLELNRLSSHLFFLSELAKALAADNISALCWREKEKFNDLLDLYCGSRLGFGAMKIGGVGANATDGFFYRIETVLKDIEVFLQEISRPFLESPVVLSRLRGLGAITKDMAAAYGLSGPNLRSCGIPRDLRASTPYESYAKLYLPLSNGDNQSGDSYSRLMIRVGEMYQSAEIIRRAMATVPAGNHCNTVSPVFSPHQMASVFTVVEGPRGQFGLSLTSDLGQTPAVARFSPPSLKHLRLGQKILKNNRTEDALLLLLSLDLSLSEVDR